jgi:hypothetical protein
MELMIITPLTRPENLNKLYNSIIKAARELKWHWMIIEDSEKVSEENFDNTFHMAYKGEGLSGNPQRNKALDLLRGYKGYVYFLDDDNIVHPYLFSSAEKRLGDTNKALIVTQIFKNNTIRLVPNYRQIIPCHIDTAQFLIPYDMIEELRWEPHNYCADGSFFSELFKNNQSRFVIAPEIICYYNYLG